MMHVTMMRVFMIDDVVSSYTLVKFLGEAAGVIKGILRVKHFVFVF